MSSPDVLSVPATAPDPARHGFEAAANLRIVLVGIGVLTGLATMAHSPWVAGAAGALVGLLLTGLVTGSARPPQLRVDGPVVVELGRAATFVVTVRNDGHRPSPRCVLRVEADTLSPLLVEVPPVPAGRHREIPLRLTAVRRGRGRVSTTLRCGDAFGLFNRVVRAVASAETAVVPPRVPPPVVPQVAVALDRTVPSQPGPEPLGVRPWRRGDSRRDVHWRSSARHSHLVVVDRPTPPVAPGLAILLAGTAGTVDDELVLAAAAALAADVTGDGGDVTCAAWTRDGQLPTGRLPFAERDLVLPRIPDVMAALPAACTVAVAAAGDVAPSWRQELTSALATRGQPVFWLQPAPVEPGRRELIAAGLSARPVGPAT